jgi:hypothetical protein
MAKMLTTTSERNNHGIFDDDKIKKEDATPQI